MWVIPALLPAGIGRHGVALGGAGTDGRFEQLAKSSLSRIDGELVVAGLRERVDVVRDRWGVPHIYAKNTRYAAECALKARWLKTGRCIVRN
jgi:acyl-homoserine lactone acylase PvdQ